ncbi:hypothetical protein CHUAL_006544 [Chamberlinius hualienensis]
MKSSLDQRNYAFNSQLVNINNKPAAELQCCNDRKHQRATIGLRLRASQETSGMAKQVKSGYLLRFKRRIFGKDWREDYVVLYSDSSLTWCRDRDRLDPDGGIYLKHSPHMIAVGQWTALVPYRPPIPNGCQVSCLMAFGTKKKDKVHWFICKDDDEVNAWMTAITKTLPPPPKPLKPISSHTQTSSREFVTKMASSSSIAINAARNPLSLPQRHLGCSYMNGTRLASCNYNRGHHLPPRPASMLQLPSSTTLEVINQHEPRNGYERRANDLSADGFHYSDTDIRINNLYDNNSSSNNFLRNKHNGVYHKSQNEHDGYADSTTAMQVAYHNDFVASELMDDDFAADGDNFDVGGFDCIF